MRFEKVYKLRTEKTLTVEHAAELLGICERTFRRWYTRYEEEGEIGLYDKRLARAAHNAAPVDEVINMLTLFETRYSDFTVSHFYDKWRSEYNGNRSYTWVKKQLQKTGLVKKAKRRGAHHKKRPRRPMRGMLIHQDGSTHEWIPSHKWDLIVTMDDATNEIYSMFFVNEEGTWSSFQGVREVIKEKGLFCSIYTDRGSHYWYTEKVGGKVDKSRLTQFGRAMQQLGIEMIPAYSPEARGRSERIFRTLQNRLPKELKLAGISDMKKANRFIKEKFLPAYNSRFAIPPQERESAFIPWRENNLKLDDILCIQEQRTVNKDNTVSYKNKFLQIFKDKYRYNYTKVKVRVHEYMDGSMSIFYGPRCLTRYNKMGQYISDNQWEKDYQFTLENMIKLDESIDLPTGSTGLYEQMRVLLTCGLVDKSIDKNIKSDNLRAIKTGHF